MHFIKQSFAAAALTGIFALASFSQAPQGFAARRAAHAGSHQGDRLAVLTKALNLSDAQVTSIRSSIQNERPALKAAFQDVKSKREALKTAASAANPNPAAVGDAFLALRSSQANVKAERQRLQAAISGVLTPEQQNSMKALKTVAQSKHARFHAFGGTATSMGS